MDPKEKQAMANLIFAFPYHSKNALLKSLKKQNIIWHRIFPCHLFQSQHFSKYCRNISSYSSADTLKTFSFKKKGKQITKLVYYP